MNDLSQIIRGNEQKFSEHAQTLGLNEDEMERLRKGMHPVTRLHAEQAVTMTEWLVAEEDMTDSMRGMGQRS